MKYTKMFFRKFRLHNIILAVILLYVQSIAVGQSSTMIKGEKVKEKELYFTLENGKIAFFTKVDGSAAVEPITEKQVFSLTRRFSNIYFEWKNPLRYKFTWKDSVYADDQQATVKSFTKLLLPLFNIPEPDAQNKSKERISKTKSSAALAKADTSLDQPEGFKDHELTFLYIQLIIGQKTMLTNPERIDINKLTKKLKRLDDSDEDLQSKVQDVFKSLFEITDPRKVNGDDNNEGEVQKQKKIIASYKSNLSKNEEARKEFSAGFKDLTITNPLMNSYVQNIISRYMERSTAMYKNNQVLVSRLEPVVDLIEKSVSPDARPGSFANFFKIRNISFDAGKILQTELLITEYKITQEKLDVEKSAIAGKASLVFREYDPISFSISTGIFYGNTTLKGFGIANKSTGEMTVTEDEIEKSSAVTALFGNINFGIGSRIFAPLLQIGIDPTKRHPFLLLGGGFSIPAANFAISAGGIWTFQSTLTKLTPGQTITSTTELEKDIKNSFQVAPKGWYIGVQYSF